MIAMCPKCEHIHNLGPFSACSQETPVIDLSKDVCRTHGIVHDDKHQCLPDAPQDSKKLCDKCKTYHVESEICPLPFKPTFRIEGECNYCKKPFERTAYTVEFKRFDMNDKGELYETHQTRQAHHYSIQQHAKTYKLCDTCATSARLRCEREE